MKQTHTIAQGSDAWHQFRLDHFGASEAAAMLGLSPKVKRSELLRMKHTGLAREFSDWMQVNVLDKGHESEALARPHVEAIVGEELFPVTMSDGRESASCDGLTLMEDIAFEHKQWNQALAAVVNSAQVPEEHMPQCQQVLMVTGAEKLIFVVSDGTPERMAYVWVYPDPAWFQRLRDGWALFEKDLSTYTLPTATEAAPVGKAPETLPALRIELKGEVTASNLAEFKQTALTAIRSVNRTLKTDEDFADARKAIKWCEDVEAKLQQAKEHALSQTASIDALFKTLGDIAAESKAVRLDLDKLVTRRSVEVKEEAVLKARDALALHVEVINAELSPHRLQPVAADFAGAIKGKRSVASMQDALDTTLAAAKIAADGQARGIRANVFAFKAKAAGFEHLFADLGTLVHKPEGDFCALIDGRIATHRAAEAEKERQRAAAEAQRIAAAEQRAREQEAARIAAEQSEAERLAKITQERESQRKAAELLTALPKAVEAGAIEPERAARLGGLVASLAADSAITEAKARADEPATLSLGAICERLSADRGRFTVSAEFLAEVLHVTPKPRADKRPGLYTESQFQAICRQLAAHASATAELYAGETA